MQNIITVTKDATSYAIPSDVSVIYFYNPFRGDVLGQVFNNIHRSIELSPRRLIIIYRNVGHLEDVVGRPDWLDKKAEVPSLHGHGFVIYESRI